MLSVDDYLPTLRWGTPRRIYGRALVGKPSQDVIDNTRLPIHESYLTESPGYYSSLYGRKIRIKAYIVAIHLWAFRSLPHYTPSRAPLVSSPSFTLQSLCSPNTHISPFLPKQKLVQPPSICTLPKSIPPLFQTLIPSPQAAYTFPNTSVFSPSGAPVSAYANTLRFVKKGVSCSHRTEYA